MAVGDYVNIILNQEGTAFISEIEDRKNYIIRRASNLSKQSHILAANLDQCMLIVTVNYPETSTTFIDRFLASAEAYRVPVKIIFNKVDAYNEEELHYLDSLINLYTTIGYPCFKVSARKGEGIDTIEKDPTATKFHDITYDEVLKRGLKVMDLTATCMCKENNLPIVVFDMDTVGNLKKVISGEEIGTIVHN